MPTTVGWLMLLLLAWLIWAWHRRLYPPPHTAAVTATVQRRLKPRTPDDCPACRRHTAPPAPSVPPPPPVTSWREIKSRRGAPKPIATQGFACPNRRCAVLSDYRRASPCPGRRRRARALRASSDVARERHVGVPSAPGALPRSIGSKPRPSALQKCSPPWRKGSLSLPRCGCSDIATPRSRDGSRGLASIAPPCTIASS